MKLIYRRYLEQRSIYSKTGKVWTIDDVPPTWREETRALVIADGYEFLEDGTAQKIVAPVESEEVTEEVTE